MKSKITLFLEYLWLGIALISFVAAMYEWYSSNLKNSSVFFVMVFISILMFSIRRNLRNKQKE